MRTHSCGSPVGRLAAGGFLDMIGQTDSANHQCDLSDLWAAADAGSSAGGAGPTQPPLVLNPKTGNAV